MTVDVSTVASITLVKRGLQTLLLGQAFRDAIEALATALGDGLTLPALRACTTAEKAALGELPMAELLGVQSDPTDDGAWSQSRAHIIAVRFYVGGSDEEAITEQTERYVLAARRMLSVDPGDEARLYPYVGGVVIPGREDYDPIVRTKSGDGTFVKVGTLELQVVTIG